MRTALIALALVACTTPPVPMVDGGQADDAGYMRDAVAPDASAFDCSRCEPIVCHPAVGTGCSCDGVTLDPRCTISCDDGSVPVCPTSIVVYCPASELPHCE